MIRNWPVFLSGCAEVIVIKKFCINRVSADEPRADGADAVKIKCYGKAREFYPPER